VLSSLQSNKKWQLKKVMVNHDILFLWQRGRDERRKESFFVR
jgi:hypothetical protein